MDHFILLSCTTPLVYRRRTEANAENRFPSTNFFFDVGLLLIIALWVVMTIIGIVSSKNGDLYRLIGPINSEGKVCGFESPVQSTKYFYTVQTNGMLAHLQCRMS